MGDRGVRNSQVEAPEHPQSPFILMVLVGESWEKKKDFEW
jgi:hypothetical protein